LHPTPTRALHLRRAECLAQKGDAEGSSREAAKAGRLTPSGVFDQFLTGRDLYKGREWARAIQHFDAVVGEEPDHFWALCLTAICDLQLQRPAEAKAVLDSCLRLRSDNAWLYLLRAHAYGVMGKAALPKGGEGLGEATAFFDAAEKDYRKAHELLDLADKELGYVFLVNRGTMRLQGLRLPEAAADLREAIGKNPKPYFPYPTLAEVYQQQGKMADAVEQASLAIERRPDLASLYRLRATLRLDRDSDVLPALLDLEEAARREPSSLSAAGDHTKRAELLFRLRRYQEARDASEAAIRIAPDSPEAHRWRVASLLELERYDDVLSSCDSYLKRGAPSSELHYIRGLARMRRNDLAGAIEDYTQAVALRPGQAKFHEQRGWAYLLNEAPRLALRDFDEALKLDPTDAEAADGRANALVVLGQRGAAVAAAEGSLRLGEPTPRMIYKAARVYALAANLTAAESHRPGLLATSITYQDRAQALLIRALERLPESERGPFLKDVILKDPALAAYRRRPRFADLVVRFGRSPR
jgi:tetratricopeptide (TPR) repeat protein